MTEQQILSSFHHPIKNTAQIKFHLKSFFKSAWQKSIEFVEKLLNLASADSIFQINLQTTPQQRTPPTQQFLREIHRKREILQTQSEFHNKEEIKIDSSHLSIDFHLLFSSDNKNKGLEHSKKRSQLGKVLLRIQGQKGRFNVSEVFKKLKSEKEQKTHKQILKISRSQFTPFHADQTSAELQGKTLKEIFLTDNEKLKPKKENKVQQNQKGSEKTAIKGFIQSSESKMISQGSSSPIVFRGDLSTILQSSNQDIQRDKQIDKGFIITDKAQKQLKTNPFLIPMKKDNSPDQEGKGDVIETMRKKLFNTAFGKPIGFVGSASPPEIKNPINIPCSIQNFSKNNIQKTQQLLGSPYLKESIQRQQASIMNRPCYNNQGRFIDGIPSNVNSNVINLQQPNTIAKPQKCIQSTSFFGQKGERQSESKKTERKVKKREKKEERIRG